MVKKEIVENKEIIDDDNKVLEELKKFLKTTVAFLDFYGNQYTIVKV